MNMIRRFDGLRILSLLVMIFIFPTLANAEVLHWWRFEEGAFREDSVGGATLAESAHQPTDLPRLNEEGEPDGGEFFPPGFTGVGPNRSAMEMLPTGGATAENTTPVEGDFTIEMFARFDSLSNETFTYFLGGQGTSARRPSQWSWGPQVRMDQVGGTQPREFVTVLSDGSLWHTPGSGILLDVNIDYYLASAFDLDGKEITYYVQDLTNGTPLQTVTVAHSLVSLNPDSNIVIGGGRGDCCVPDGLIDEFRFSNDVLSSDELLINNVVPEPGTAVLSWMGFVCMLAWRRKKSSVI